MDFTFHYQKIPYLDEPNVDILVFLVIALKGFKVIMILKVGIILYVKYDFFNLIGSCTLAFDSN